MALKGHARLPSARERSRPPHQGFWTPVACDTPTVSSTYTDVALQAAILRELEHGPAFKAELHRRLQVNEERIGRQLRVLRERRVVTLDKQKRWLLAMAVAQPTVADRKPEVSHSRFPRPLEERYKDLLT